MVCKTCCKIIRRSSYGLNKNCNISIYGPNTTQVNDIVYALNEKNRLRLIGYLLNCNEKRLRLIYEFESTM